MHLVLISSTADHVSGWGTMTHNHARQLWQRGQPFSLLLPQSDCPYQVPYSEKINYLLPKLPLSFNSVGGLKSLPLLFKKIRFSSSGQTVIHSLVDFPYAALAYRLSKQLNCPFIFTAHGTFSVWPFTKLVDRKLMMATYKKAAAIIAVSSFTAQQMQAVSQYQRKIDVVNNPVGFFPTNVADSGVYNFLPKGSRVILSVAPLKPRKGIDILIKALPLIVKQVPAAQLVVAASYGDETFYKQLASSLRVNQHFHVLREVSSQKLAALFQHCDLFALTPRYLDLQFEGYGLVYLEAGLYKKPVVGTVSGGVPEAVHHNKTGLLVPENNIKAVSEALIKILTDENLAISLGEGGWQLAKERNWDSYLNQIMTIYESCF